MSPKDQEMAEQIFDEGDDNVQDLGEELTPEELSRVAFAFNMIGSFEHEISVLALTRDFFFLAPPTNFSYAVN